jgi:hypothetical protein
VNGPRTQFGTSLLVVSALGAGCKFDAPSYEGTSYTCPPPAARCPAGHDCVDGVCVSADDVDATVNTTTMRVEVAYDVSILSDAPTQNGAALEFLEMDAAPRRVALIQFDLTGFPTDAQVVGAELRVVVFDPLETGTFQLFPLTESWTETGATWDERETGVPWSGGPSRPSLDANALLGEFAPRVAGAAAVGLDAARVQRWIAMPAGNHGFAVVSTSPDGRGGRFHSREYMTAADRPYLNVALVAP